MSENTEDARLRQALEHIQARAAKLGNIAGAYGFEEIARRALAGEDIAPEPCLMDQPDLHTSLTTQPPPFLLVSFLVTRDAEQQHPMDVSVVKLNLNADGVPDEASLTDLTNRVSRHCALKTGERDA
ncbi:hypothetical protein [Nucisporomicrobium flavum]|uniref:hypothetical protein n=1 Tax=Nucisporomicrobium flavum TaxID=2785915 RepID=UPI0018F504C0|nr:hypothetical protein [Nucisporomicrobium flavum]